MKNAGGTQAGGEAPEVVHYALGAPWQPLDPETRAHMETRFGHDLGHVRIHTDDRAAQSARAIRARAYTIGSDIVFGRSQFQPATKQGQFLLAHELTHVVQQDSSRAHRQADESSLPADAAQAGPSSPSAQNNSIATQRLLAIIADIERLQAGTASMDADTVEGNAGQLSRFVDQLRAVANGGDENLKLQVLAGFNSVGVQQAELQLSNPDAQVQQETPAGVAAKSLEVSDPRDAAEVEADRVADAIVNGSPAAVALTTSASLVNRQLGPALVGAGTGILTLEVESTPATSWNPPGWVILGVATLIAAGLITAGILMAENVGDTGIMDEVNQLIQGAKAAGTALSICEALAQLMNAAKQAGDTQRMQRIKKTQKAKGCRHSTFS